MHIQVSAHWVEDKNIETGRVLAGMNIERFWQ